MKSMAYKSIKTQWLSNLILTIFLTLGLSPAWADEATTAGSANPMLNGGAEIFKTEGTVQLKCSTGGLPPVEGVKVACDNNEGASICEGAGSSGGGKNKVPSKSSSGKGGVSGIQVSRVMYDCLNKIIPICAKAAGCSDNKVKLNTMGGHADRAKNTPGGKSNSASKHCGGFAIDFADIECGGGGKKLELTKPGRGKDQKGYDDFRNCWDSEVEKQCKNLKAAIEERYGRSIASTNPFGLFFSLIESAHAGSGGKHSIACTGAPTPANTKHDDHMHGSVDSPTGQPSGI